MVHALAHVPIRGLDTDQVVALWRCWIERALGDVLGVLNIGPAFLPNMAALLAIMRSKPDAGGFTLPNVSMRSVSPAGTAIDPSPTDILRIHVAMGAIAGLSRLAPATRERHVAVGEEIASVCATGDGIEITGIASDNGRGGTEIAGTFPLGDMQAAARRIGEYICTVHLQALGGHGLQDALTWADGDEARAERVRDALAAGTPIAALGRDAHLLAGATLRLLDTPGDYATITVSLEAGLDQSFATDTVWGSFVRDPLFRSQSAAPISIPVPPAAKPCRHPQEKIRKTS